MKATCPNNPEHNRFSTTAHVSQEWEVDRNGDFQSEIVSCLDITHYPNPQNLWICLDCADDGKLDVYAEVSE